MFSNEEHSAFPQDVSAYQPASAPRGWIDQTAPNSNQQAATIPSEQSNASSSPFLDTKGTANPYAENGFVWNGSSQDDASRQFQQPPRPPRPPFNPQQFDRRLDRLERSQARTDREIQNLDRRVRAIERRLGFPIPPIGGPGFPQR
ncbi:hypothetical protein [Sporolactobacillus inulinus]|uniref:Uncharacterized protein n=2 Tax=Sporolactobacillus inulinus TaxID=2078 RepID=A0A4Y3T2S6_9BACL|nr:hypothetical protein [Sporolactobacillus inulinus]KLI02841.1 hypothetical protein SINU_05835 [Sporolactobacillus inulinus CASD]GAY77527.1 hypothetical protein NBRC111894_3081 [Sporolactobacillus inulinus]GEB75753.1 hypothetical protein SIN01_00980 [Sporolactobacillus inulinus]